MFQVLLLYQIILKINGTTQLDPKILLSGQEYLVTYTTSTDCVALVLGANRTNTRLLFIADSTKLIQNATNPVVSINPTGRFDCTSTDSTTRLPAVFLWSFIYKWHI
jgi:hypothetical protein